MLSLIRPLLVGADVTRLRDQTVEFPRVATRPAARRPSGRWAAPLKTSFPIVSNRSVPAVGVLATASAAPLSRSASEDKAARPQAAPKFILRTLNGNGWGVDRSWDGFTGFQGQSLGRLEGESDRDQNPLSPCGIDKFIWLGWQSPVPTSFRGESPEVELEFLK